MICFRTASADDAMLIAQMHVTSWRSAYAHFFDPAYLDERIVEERRATWAGQLAAPAEDNRLFIAEDDGHAIGFIYIVRNDDPRWGTLVDNLHVMPDVKGAGLGRKLLARAAEWSMERYPQTGLYLWCYEDNLAGRGFYDRIGGTIVEQTAKPAPDGQLRGEFRYHWPDPETLIRA